LNTVSQKKVISCFISEGGASYTPSTNELKIDPGHGSEANSGKKKSSKTVWNIFNMLGAHEYLGHKVIGWRDLTRTHYLVYLFQKRHRTWKKTTEEFKKSTDDKLNYYLGKNQVKDANIERYLTTPYNTDNTENTEKKIKAKEDAYYLNILKREGLWPEHKLSDSESNRFFDSISKSFLEDARKIKNPFKK
jgi:hypothetical protein